MQLLEVQLEQFKSQHERRYEDLIRRLSSVESRTP